MSEHQGAKCVWTLLRVRSTRWQGSSVKGDGEYSGLRDHRVTVAALSLPCKGSHRQYANALGVVIPPKNFI